jgi:hypothetical protein
MPENLSKHSGSYAVECFNGPDFSLKNNGGGERI